MPKRDIIPGMKGREETVVNRMISAAAIKDGLAEVFGTPFLVMLMENAAVEAITPCLGAGEGSVGIGLDQVRHHAATPLGMKVWAVAEVTEVHGSRIRFHIDAYDETGPIGGAEHERAVIRQDDFMRKVRQMVRTEENA